jgi:hypothetical protein
LIPPEKYPALLFLIQGIPKSLVRDGLRCILTGGYDYRFLIDAVHQEVTDSGAGATSTACVHIFPQSIAPKSGIDDKDAEVRFADLSFVAINHACL